VVSIERVGSFTLGWGESLVWDEERSRLWFADCAAQTLHWIDHGDDELHALAAPSLPTGIVPTTDGRLLVALHDGLHVVDPDTESWTLVSAYPDEVGGRCNDACADLDGNVITGKLNLGPAEGAAWWWSAVDGWRVVDPAISNTNGPAVAVLDGAMTLLVGDTAADYYAFDYVAGTGQVGPRRVFGAVADLDGHPDGATLDTDGGYWCALVGGSQLARFTTTGLDRTLALPVVNPTDVTFGGPGLDRLYVTSIAGAPDTDPGLEGALLVIDGLPERGRLEPRAALGVG
jgi:sugar lactone lactonase YvrE